MKSLWLFFVCVYTTSGILKGTSHGSLRENYKTGQNETKWMKRNLPSLSSKYANEKAERNAEEGKVKSFPAVLNFCCERHFFFAMTNTSVVCSPSQELLNPKFHTRDGEELKSHEVNFTNVTRMNNCSSFVLPSSEFRLLVDGQMLMKGLPEKNNDQLIPSEDYCLLWMEQNQTLAMSALVCFPDVDVQMSLFEKVVHIYVLPISMGISALFLAATFFVYCVVDELQDLLGKSFMCSVAAMFLSNVVGAITKAFTRYFSLRQCVTMAMLMHLGFLHAFFWLNVISFIVFSSICFQEKFANISRKKWFTVGCIYAFGVPLIIITLILIHDLTPHLDSLVVPKPGFGDGSCGFSNRGAQVIYFYAPISFLLGINLILFCTSACRLFILSKQTSVFSFQFTHYLKLLVLMGIPWIFEILSFFFGQNEEFSFATILWMIFDVFNALQGIIIFIIFACRRTVFAKLSERLCGLPYAKRRYPDVMLQCTSDETQDVLTQDLRIPQAEERALANFESCEYK